MDLWQQWQAIYISQSVLASFFLRVSTGQYELEEPAQLVKLLVGMTRNKVAFQARKQRALGRDHRRVEALDPANCDVAAADPSPSQVMAHQACKHQVNNGLFRCKVTA
jgi:hypothetical protein